MSIIMHASFGEDQLRGFGRFHWLASSPLQHSHYFTNGWTGIKFRQQRPKKLDCQWLKDGCIEAERRRWRASSADDAGSRWRRRLDVDQRTFVFAVFSWCRLERIHLAASLMQVEMMFWSSSCFKRCPWRSAVLTFKTRQTSSPQYLSQHISLRTSARTLDRRPPHCFACHFDGHHLPGDRSALPHLWLGTHCHLRC